MAEEHSWIKDLILAQQACKPFVKDLKNPRFGNKYVSLDAAIEACQEALHGHGWATWWADECENGASLWAFYAAHAPSGHVIRSAAIIPQAEDPQFFDAVRTVLPTARIPQSQDDADDRKWLLGLIANNPQKVMTWKTYTSRRQLCGFLFAAAEDDDDGNAASPKPNGQRSAAKSTGNPDLDKDIATMYRKLTEAFGNGKPWEDPKKTVLLKVFGKLKKADIAALGASVVHARVNNELPQAISAQLAGENAVSFHEGETAPPPDQEPPPDDSLPF